MKRKKTKAQRIDDLEIEVVNLESKLSLSKATEVSLRTALDQVNGKLAKEKVRADEAEEKVKTIRSAFGPLHTAIYR